MGKKKISCFIVAGFLLWPWAVRADSGDLTPVLPISTDENGNIVLTAIPGVPKIFLPDIGIAGDFAYERNSLPKSDPRYNPSQEQPRIRDGQAVFFSPIDPYTKAQFTIDLPETGVANIEEAWIYTDKLPGGAGLRIGRFLPQFGLLDLVNTFQLAMLDRPNAIGAYLGSDGLNSTGAELNFYVPNPWDVNLKADFEAVRGDLVNPANQSADLAYLATLDYSRDLLTTGSLQSGVSVLEAPAPLGLSETLTEPYLQIIYAPSERKIWTWSAEGMLAERQGLGTQNFKSGFYTFLDYNFALRYHVGFLVDDADLPGAVPGTATVLPSGQQLSLAPNFTWFISDNTRMRVQYTHTTALGSERPDETVGLQATFSLGNLKQLD